MRTRIKICCIVSVREAELAVAAGADALGLVSAMPSGPGVIGDREIAAIARSVPPPVATFLLTSAVSADVIADQALAAGVNAVQIVSHIAPGESARLAALLPAVRRIQVVHVEDARAPSLIDVYAPHVDAFLLDSGRPGLSVPELGGTGRVHDWAISAEFARRSARPVFLAGGLTPDNVRDAIRTVRPFGLDVCSGVRTNGALDADKLTRFVQAVSVA
jgi:phosphoribosylanthranilate isomerase